MKNELLTSADNLTPPKYSFVLLVALAGCGGEPSSTGAFASGLPGDTKLGTLSPQQQAMLCRQARAILANWQPELDEISCRQEGQRAAMAALSGTDAAARLACRQARDRCRANSIDPAGADPNAPLTCENVPTDCAATVAEYSSCLNEIDASLAMALAGTPNCDTLMLSDLADGGLVGGLVLSDSCVKGLAQKCPAMTAPTTLDMDLGGGPYNITGTIQLSSAAPASSFANLVIDDASVLAPAPPDGANFASYGSTIAGGSSIAYRVRNVAAGNYLLGAYVDSNVDGQVDEGDLAGFFGGTTTAPVLESSRAMVVHLTGSLDGVDFGIGPVGLPRP